MKMAGSTLETLAAGSQMEHSRVDRKKHSSNSVLPVCVHNEQVCGRMCMKKLVHSDITRIGKESFQDCTLLSRQV